MTSGLLRSARAFALFTLTLAWSAAHAQTSFIDSYSGAPAGGGGCSSSYNISGMEPTGAGPYPVFVYMVGTNENYTNAAAMEAVKRMAAKGFVAATVQYGSSLFGGCSAIDSKAACVFNPSSAASAVAKLCARGKADCGKGIVVGGFSQGSLMAILAKNHDARVQAAYGLGAGVQYSSYNLRSCVANGNRSLPSARLRAINGEADDFMGGSASGVRAQLQELTGASCGSTAYGCLGSGGAGWVMVKHSQVGDRYAEHCYMRRSGGCVGSQGSLDAGWQGGTQDWQLESNLNWLSGFVTK